MSDYNLTDENGHIINGLRADVMRCCMENKNLLWEKGSIYVGTGETFVVGGEQICKTSSLSLGDPGDVLMSMGGELIYSQITEDNMYLEFSKSSDSLRVDRTSSNFLGNVPNGSYQPACSCICSFSGKWDVSSTDREDIFKHVRIRFGSASVSGFSIRSGDESSHFAFLIIRDEATGNTFDYGLVYLPGKEDDGVIYLPVVVSSDNQSYDYQAQALLSRFNVYLYRSGTSYLMELGQGFSSSGGLVFLTEIE